MSKLGVTKFCIFNQPEDIRHNITNKEYREYVESISSYKAFNVTSNIVQKETMGVAIFKAFILMKNLEPNDCIFLFMPTHLYSSDGNTDPSNFTMVTNLIPGTQKVIRVQLTRVRTTHTIWGFNIGGNIGDQYEENISVNYPLDDTNMKLGNIEGLNTSVYI